LKALQKTEFSEFFIFASFGIVRFSKFGKFSKKPGISEFAKILWKNFGNKFGSIPPVIGSKKLFLRQKQGFWGQKQGFPNILNLRNIRNIFYSEFPENYKNVMSKSNFYFREKLVPTQILTQIFEFKFGMQALLFFALLV